MDSRQAGTLLGKKLEISSQFADLHTPHLFFRSFPPRGIFRGMGVLPKNSAYLKNDYFCTMNILIDIPQGPLIGFEYYGPDEEFDFSELQVSLLIIRFTFTWH
jgi:hypothetical protein